MKAWVRNALVTLGCALALTLGGAGFSARLELGTLRAQFDAAQQATERERERTAEERKALRQEMASLRTLLQEAIQEVAKLNGRLEK